MSYRTPAEVVEVAGRVLAVAAPGITPPRPVRRSGYRPVFAMAPRADLAAAVAEVAEAEVAAVAGGRVAVLVPAARFDEIGRALSERGLGAVDPRDPAAAGCRRRWCCCRPTESNGLEFDSVVVVEPALIAAGEPPARSTARARSPPHPGPADPLRGPDPADPAPGGGRPPGRCRRRLAGTAD